MSKCIDEVVTGPPPRGLVQPPSAAPPSPAPEASVVPAAVVSPAASVPVGVPGGFVASFAAVLASSDPAPAPPLSGGCAPPSAAVVIPGAWGDPGLPSGETPEADPPPHAESVTRARAIRRTATLYPRSDAARIRTGRSWAHPAGWARSYRPASPEQEPTS